MQRSGYVRRERDPDDRHKVIIQPTWTPGRQEAANRIFGSLLRALKENLAEYGDDQLAFILVLMARSKRTLQRVTREVRDGEDAAGATG